MSVLKPLLYTASIKPTAAYRPENTAERDYSMRLSPGVCVCVGVCQTINPRVGLDVDTKSHTTRQKDNALLLILKIKVKSVLD